MISENKIRQDMWSQQQIKSADVDYTYWKKQRNSVQELSRLSNSCLFTVDVYKGIYDYASEGFSELFGFRQAHLDTIQRQGDLLEERMHPDDRGQLLKKQIEHSHFIYSLPAADRNDYRQSFQFRMLNSKQQYVNVISTQQVIQKDRNGKAWIILGAMHISPDQVQTGKIKHTVFNRKNGEIVNPLLYSSTTDIGLTGREKEILSLIKQGLLSKEIAFRLNISVNTVNNHRKNILTRLEVNNSIEAINLAEDKGIF